jgi:hypothetical protein
VLASLLELILVVLHKGRLRLHAIGYISYADSQWYDEEDTA